MSAISHSDRQVLESGVLILYFETVGIDGEHYYAYIAMKPLDMPKFEAARKRGKFKLQDYGKILAGGKGKPTDAVKQFIKDEYGFDVTQTAMMYQKAE